MFTRFVSAGALLVSALFAGALMYTSAPGQGHPPTPIRYGASGAAGLQGTAEYTTPGPYVWIAPPYVHSVVVELWGAGGGGSRPYGYQSAGDGGGSGAYVRTVVAVDPGVSYTLTVGTGGLGGAFPAPFATPGDTGDPTTFADASGQLLGWAGGGYGGNDLNDGHGGTADPNAQIRRDGRNGGHGFGITPGQGGRAVTGSLEPPAPLGGGAGGAGQINASGADGSPGYAILLW